MQNTLTTGKTACWGMLALGFLSLTGCRTGDLSLSPKSPPATPLQPVQNRASQIEVLATRVVDVPYVSERQPTVTGTFPEAVVRWRNNGPEPVGMVRARLYTWDSQGKELPHSPTTVTIFFARSDTRRIKANQVYDEPAGKGHALLFGPPKAARAKAVIVYADDAPHAHDDGYKWQEAQKYAR